MKKQRYDLRTGYNLASIKAERMLGLRDNSVVGRALYGVYCEALASVQEAIREGAQIGDLEREIKEFGAEQGRIV